MTGDPRKPGARDPLPLESAVVVAVDVPELETIYRNSYPELAAVGIPLHVTLLYPFAEPAELGSTLPPLREVLAAYPRFTFELTELRTFPRTVWLAPEPVAPFVALTRAIQATFPQYPYWQGRFEEVIPHVTLSDGLAEDELEPTFRHLQTLVEPLLPFRVAADEATVLAEQPGGHWTAAAHAPLGPG